MGVTDGNSKKSTRRTKGDGGLYYDEKRGLHIGIIWVTDENGRRKQKRVSSKSKALATDKLNRLRSDLLSGTVTNRPKDIKTVGDWLDSWLAIRKSNLAPTSHRDYSGTVRLYLKPHIGHHKLDKLTPQQIRNGYAKLDSTRSQVKAHQVLKMALKQARREGYIRNNPADAVENPKHTKKQRGVFDGKLVQELLRTAAALDEANPDRAQLASRWAAAFMTGARKSELLGLEWDRVNLENRSADIAWQLQRHQKVHGCGEPDDAGKYPCKRSRPGYCPESRWDIPKHYEHRPCHKSLLWTRPKTEAGQRFIPLAPMLEAALRMHLTMDLSPNPHGLVWHHPDGRPISPEDDAKFWNDLLKAAGVERTAGEAVLHEARNTAATMMLESGVDPKIIQNIMGHASILQTRDYQRVSLALAQKAVSGAFSDLNR